ERAPRRRHASRGCVLLSREGREETPAAGAGRILKHRSGHVSRVSTTVRPRRGRDRVPFRVPRLERGSRGCQRDAVQPKVDPFAPAKLGPIELPNRFLKAATFEGMAPRRVVTDALIDFHRAVAAGGVGMTTLAYCAVSPDGRGAPG